MWMKSLLSIWGIWRIRIIDFMTQHNYRGNILPVESKNYFTSISAGITLIGHLPVSYSLKATGE